MYNESDEASALHKHTTHGRKLYIFFFFSLLIAVQYNNNYWTTRYGFE